MPMLSTYGERREIEPQSFPIGVVIAAPLVAITVQSLVTLHFPRFAIIDLPLLITIYFAISRRYPISATLTGALIGIGQDALTHLPIGVNGIANSLAGYLAASLGVKIDVDNHGTRVLLNFSFTLLHGFVYWVIAHHMLGQQMAWNWIYEVARAVGNTLIGIVLFALLDRTRRSE